MKKEAEGGSRRIYYYCQEKGHIIYYYINNLIRKNPHTIKIKQTKKEKNPK
jgi:hypothetical protein